MQFKRQQLDTRDKIGHELARYQGKVALITGASSGIGKAFARELARRGMDLILVARSEQRLQQISTELTVLYGIQASVIAADLSQPDAVQKIKATVDARGLAVHLLVNNAGFGVRERFEKIDPVRDHEQVMVNVAAVVDLTHAFLPGMLARNEGAVINLGALAGFQPVGYFAVHAASKAFIHAFRNSPYPYTFGDPRGGIRII
ncbi:MAG TPA: SDR family NAD(P)-dependent oxidoreductase [Ktedonosporobacter sp.]|nr:SDR family NAD(P)-dependent oxidoreductase [Ktedonosporobacter sp.]